MTIMANVATYLKPNLKSTYNLWKLLSEGHSVTCYYFHLNKRPYGQHYNNATGAPPFIDTFSVAPSDDDRNSAQSIATWLNDNVATFTYEVLDDDNYTTNWTGSPDLECLHKASQGSFDRISLFHTVEDLDIDHIQRRKAANRITTSNTSFSSISLNYPLIDSNLGNIHAVQELPADLLALISDPWISVRQAYVSGGTSNNEVIAIEKSFHQANNSTYCGTDRLDGEWFVDNHPQYGSYIESDKTKFTFGRIHRYYLYLTV